MGGKSLSSSLSYLSTLLSSLGIKPFPSHVLLLGAANDPSATSSIVPFLANLVVFHLAFPPLHNTHNHTGRINLGSQAQDKKNAIKAGHKSHPQSTNHDSLTLDHLDMIPDPNASQEGKLSFVKFYLALWGYAPSSPFFTLHHETSESRHLLLALGWLINHCNIFSRALEKRFSGFMGNTPIVTKTHLDTLAMDKGRVAMVEAREYVAKVMAASSRLGESREKVKAKGEQLLMLCGRLRMNLRSLYALVSCKAKRSHELNQMQLVNNVRGPDGHPFSPFELHLLEHHKALEQYLMTLEMAKCMIIEIVECDQLEGIFWQWMGEVAIEARNNLPKKNMEQQLITTSGVCASDLLPVFSYFRSKLNHHYSTEGTSHLSKELKNGDDNNDKATSQVDIIPTPIVVIWKEIQGRETEGAFVDEFGAKKETFEVFSSLQRHLLPHEAVCKSQHTQCLDEKHFKSVKDIATSLVSMLAKIRIKNRAIIEEALKASITNKDHLFAGL